jgi:hypothetical protein
MWQFLFLVLIRLAVELMRIWALEEDSIGCWLFAVLLPIMIWGIILICR